MPKTQSHRQQVKAAYRARIDQMMDSGWTAERSIQCILDRDGHSGLMSPLRRTILSELRREYTGPAATLEGARQQRMAYLLSGR